MTLSEVLSQAGILHADAVIRECETHGVPVECVCVLLVKESGGGRNVYGHDLNACFSVGGVDILVSRENYAEYLKCVEAGGKRNGVGPMQLTYWSLQQRADELGGCWDPEVNIRVGVEHFANLLRTSDTVRTAFRRYNAGGAATANPDPNGPGERYADDAMTRLPRWQRLVAEATMPVLVVQMGHVGRPPCPGSVGTAGEQEFTKRAAAACKRLLDGRGGWTVKVIDADPNYSAVPKLGGNPDYYKGDAFVAIHCDGSTNPDRNGASFGYRSGGRLFAQDIKGAYLNRTGKPASWLEPDNYTTNLSGYYGTGIATSVGNTRAVIFETGFLTNPQDRDMLLAPTGPDNVALAIGDALGIPTSSPSQEAPMGDVDWADPITRQSVPGFPKSGTTTLRDTVAYLDSNLESIRGPLMALGPPIADIRNKVDQLLALHGGETAWQEAVQRIEAASAQAAREGAREGVMAEVLAALDEMEQRLQADDAEQAKQGALQALRGLRDVLPE